MLWSPTIRAALLAGTPWLDIFCPGVDREKYAWSLYRNGISEPIKFSVPIFSTEADATAAGLQVLARINLRKKQFGMSKIPRSAL